MRLPSIGVTVFFGLLLAEVLAYSVAIKQFGWIASILFGLFSFGCGILILRRLGLHIGDIAADNLNHGRVEWHRIQSWGWLVSAAILLILPGFITNLAGLTITLFRLRLLFSDHDASNAGLDQQVLDLEPTEWNVSQQKKPGDFVDSNSKQIEPTNRR